MIPRKLIEAVFRRFWLLLVPIVATPLLVVALTSTPVRYQSTATVWVSQPSNIDPTSFSQASNPYQTAAAVQVQSLRDLLATKTFRGAVSSDAGLDVATGPDEVATAVNVTAAGSNLIAITATRGDAQSAQKIVDAVVNQYQVKTGDESQRETAIAVEYYNKQIALAQAELDTRKADLNTYATANAKVADLKTADPTYIRLLGAVDSQSKIVDNLELALQDAQRKAAAAPQSLAATFNVQDVASLPEAPIPVSATKRLGYPFAALFLGIALSASVLYVTFRTDHTIRSSEDIAGLQVPLLGYVPDIPAAGRGLLSRLQPLAWLINQRRRDYARAVAASISTIPARESSR